MSPQLFSWQCGCGNQSDVSCRCYCFCIVVVFARAAGGRAGVRVVTASTHPLTPLFSPSLRFLTTSLPTFSSPRPRRAAYPPSEAVSGQPFKHTESPHLLPLEWRTLSARVRGEHCRYQGGVYNKHPRSLYSSHAPPSHVDFGRTPRGLPPQHRQPADEEAVAVWWRKGCSFVVFLRRVRLLYVVRPPRPPPPGGGQ